MYVYWVGKAGMVLIGGGSGEPMAYIVCGTDVRNVAQTDVITL
jgi:hypothetical protein